jgi:hypothetical protein
MKPVLSRTYFSVPFIWNQQHPTMIARPIDFKRFIQVNKADRLFCRHRCVNTLIWSTYEDSYLFFYIFIFISLVFFFCDYCSMFFHFHFFFYFFFLSNHQTHMIWYCMHITRLYMRKWTQNIHLKIQMLYTIIKHKKI